MTMIDERALEELLARAAEEVAVPVDGAARIEAAAESLERRSFRAVRERTAAGGEGDGHLARTVQLVRSHRVAAVAAAVVLVALTGVASLGLAGSFGTPSQPELGRAILGPRSALKSAGAAPDAPSPSPAYGGAGQAALAPVAPSGSQGSPPPHATVPGGDVAGQKIESTGSMNLTVTHIDTAVAALTTLAAGDGGYVAGEQTQSASPGTPASGVVTLQVPQTGFSTLIGQVERLGSSSAVSTKQVDVTGQYVDLQAQITALRASQAQYLTIMSKAQTIGDILAVQQQLDSIDSQLQQVEGEMHVLDSETSYGTLTVDLSEPGPKPAAVAKVVSKPPTGLAAAWDSARHGFADGVYWVVRQTGGLAFLILLAGLLYLLGRVGWRGLRRLAL